MANVKAVSLSSKVEVIMSLLKMMGLEKLDDDNINLVYATQCSQELKSALGAACASAIVTLEQVKALCK